MKTLPVAVQVYSVREDAERDFAGTMKKIKEMGYGRPVRPDPQRGESRH